MPKHKFDKLLPQVTIDEIARLLLCESLVESIEQVTISSELHLDILEASRVEGGRDVRQ